ncbi:MAG: spore germination protein [Clostridiaceae bacterium]
MKEDVKKEISKKIDNNISYLKEILKDASDIVYREFNSGDVKFLLVYVDGMGDKVLLDDFVLKPLLKEDIQIDNLSKIKEKIIAVTDLREVEEFDKAINAVLSGDTMMLMDGESKAFVIASRSWPLRGVGEPSGETVVRGARDGFTETIRFNTALVRRRIRDTRLKIKPQPLGVRSKSDVFIMYIDDIVNKDVLKECEKRISEINIDAVLDSGYVEQLIEDNKFSPFPQIQSTERPDVVAAALYEGRVAILVDNSPFALIVPAVLPTFFQSPDDYYQRWMYSTCVRWIRFIAIILALILPALYVAVTSYNTNIIPTKLAYSIAATREGVPFPAFVETLIMEFALALLMEAIIRLPKPIGSTIGIVGGLVIGQAAVSASIVSPILLIIISLTTLTSFITPNYAITFAFRILRFLLIIAAALGGLFGLMIGVILSLIHLTRLKSFGISYLAPLTNTEFKDFKDVFFKFPINTLKSRPEYMSTGDKIRQK